MNNKTSLLAVGLFTLAFAIPAVHAETPGISNPTTSTPTNLYFHINGFQDFPINTQPPADTYKADEGIGLATHSASCAPPGTPVDGAVRHSYHTSYGFSSPSYVEYNFTDSDGKPRIHPERALSYDILVDSASDFSVHWFVSTQTGLPAQPTADPNTAPVVVPEVIVRATMRTGEKISVGEEGYNTGTLIAQGQTLPAILAAQGTQSANANAPGHQNANWTVVDGKNVYELVVPMKFEGQSKIPKEEGYNMRIDVFEAVPGGACDNPDNGYFMPNVVKTHTSPGHRPHMSLSITDPVRIEYMHPQFVGDDLVIHTSENSPWGNYDVDETAGGIELTIAGPSEARSLYRAAVVQRYHEHDHHTQAVDVTFVWPFKTDFGKDGTYTIHLAVKNDQGTAVASGIAQFTIGKGGTELFVTKCGGIIDTNKAAGAGQDCVTEQQDPNSGEAITAAPKSSPGVEMVAVLGALGAVAYAVRRRQA